MNKRDINWEKMYTYAKQYYEKYGHLLISYSYRVDETGKELLKGTLEYDSKSSIKLGSWIVTQRKAYKGIDHCVMTEERKQKLDNIGMVWSFGQHTDRENCKWERMFAYAKKYYEEHGDLLISSTYCVDLDGNELKKNVKYSSKQIIKLGNWLYLQRRFYRESLNKGVWRKRFERLESIGMEWNSTPGFDKNWNNMFAYAKKYYEKYGHLLISANYRIDINGNELIKGTEEYNSKDAIHLGTWIITQRSGHCNDKTKKWMLKKARLDTIGMIWRDSNNRFSIIRLCEDYGIDLSSNQFLLKKAYLEILVKLEYLNDIDQKPMNNGILHPIFAMSDINMQAIYGVSMELLIGKYANQKCKVIL